VIIQLGSTKKRYLEEVTFQVRNKSSYSATTLDLPRGTNTPKTGFYFHPVFYFIMKDPSHLLVLSFKDGISSK
jgi:hypothetical protein